MSYKRYQQNGKKHENTTKPVLSKAHGERSLPRTRKKLLRNGQLFLVLGGSNFGKVGFILWHITLPFITP